MLLSQDEVQGLIFEMKHSFKRYGSNIYIGSPMNCKIKKC